MRINKFVALATGMSRRAADDAIAQSRVKLNGKPAGLGDLVAEADSVSLDDHVITPAVKTVTIMLNKPVGYVVSRDGQGSKTIYDLLPLEYHTLKPVGRLDKDSSGLLLLTNDGQLAHELTHPSHQKKKVYEIALSKPLTPRNGDQITQTGVQLEDGLSKFDIKPLPLITKSRKSPDSSYVVTMYEGRNRQIRRTFETLGYKVINLHRTDFGPYRLSDLAAGKSIVLWP